MTSFQYSALVDPVCGIGQLKSHNDCVAFLLHSSESSSHFLHLFGMGMQSLNRENAWLGSHHLISI